MMDEKRPPIQTRISRILALDLMRGYFLIAILLNHLHYWPNGLDFLTMRGELFVSAAEGFFLISGIVLGIVRGQKLLNKPFATGAKLLLKRSFQLYITYVVLAVFSTLIGWWFFYDNPGLKNGILPRDTTIISMLWQTLSLQYLYGWADYLRLYAIFIFVSPIAMLLLRKGLWNIVLAASLAVYLLSPDPTWPESVMTQPYHWQLIFFFGLVLGFHWNSVTEFWKSLHERVRKLVITSTVSIAVITLLLNTLYVFSGFINTALYENLTTIHQALTPYFNKENLPLPRLILFGIWFSASFWLFTKYEKHILKKIGWLLVPFGTNSLYVYTVHALLIFFVHLVIPSGSQVFWINALLSFGLISLTYYMVKYKILFKIIPR